MKRETRCCNRLAGAKRSFASPRLQSGVLDIVVKPAIQFTLKRDYFFEDHNKYRGMKYLHETLKMLPQKPDPIVIDEIAEHLGSIGAIHYTSPQIRPG